MSLKRLITGLFVVGMGMLISCNKDKEEPIPASTMTVNGQTFDLVNGYIEDCGTDECNNCTDIDVWATTEGLTITSTGISGSGELVRLDLNTSGLSELASGTYTWSISRIPESIVEAWVWTSCAVECDTTACVLVCQTDDVGVAGSVTVSKVGENFRIDFEITLNTGSTATGTYFGTLTDIQLLC